MKLTILVFGLDVELLSFIEDIILDWD